MKRKINIIGLTLFFTLALFSFVFSEESMTITTYYPSPYGSYNQLQTNSLGVGDNNNNSRLDSGDIPATAGDVWIRGKVGIGTAEPLGKLHLSIGPEWAMIVDRDTNRFRLDGMYGGVGSGGPVALIANNDIGLDARGDTVSPRQLYLDNTGKVGIGTTEPASRLHVRHDQDAVSAIRLDNLSTAGGTASKARIVANYNSAGLGCRSWGFQTPVSVTTDGNFGIFDYGCDPTSVGTPRLVIDYSAGKVGIGTAEPLGKLHLSIGPEWAMIVDRGTNRFRLDGMYGGVGSGGPVALIANNDIGLDARGDTVSPRQLYLDNTGNVGIGMASPSEKLHVVGNIYKTGTVSFVQDHPTDPSKEIVYVSLEGGEAGTYVRGEAKLVNGEAEIKLPEHFSLVTASETGLTAQITPIDECQGLRVVKLSHNSLIVKELNGGRNNAKFYYLINGVRKGYGGYNPIKQKL